ncbi:MAG TPA: glycosyltransferase family 2 protein [bacterium]|nr:glycosyltransferase family 2 protein [bacterium]HPT29969.1 glycosyltransferase family 2 protein [bacterium]
MARIAIIIPGLNEARSIAAVVSSVKPLAEWVIVVDDGSTDNTRQLAQDAGALVLTHKINRGQGAALETGDQKAKSLGAEIIVHFDADGQFLASDIAKVCAPIINGQADIVFGSRFLSDNQLPWAKAKIIMPLAKTLSRLIWNIKLTDPQSGFRAFNRKVADTLTIENDRMAHCSEIIIKAHRNKYRVQEVPITVIYHRFGQNFGGGLRIIKDLIYKAITK